MAMRVLLANEPRAYRDTIAVALGLLRPSDTVIVTDPDSLDRTVLEQCPQVVICSELTPLVESRVPTWMLLYPDGSQVALRYQGGVRSYVEEVDLAGIAQLVAKAKEAEAS